MKQKTKADKGKVSLENFEPAGPRDRPIDSPRSLMACQYIGVQPSELFLLNEDELIEQLDKESIKASDKKVAYENYIKEMKHIFEKLAQIRHQLIEDEKSKKKRANKHGSVKAKKDRSIRQYPENDELAGEDIHQAAEDGNQKAEEPSEGAAMNSKDIFKKKKKPAKYLSKSVRPSKQMLEKFQTTQYLPAGLLQSASRENTYKEVNPMEKMAKVVAREQRRQQTLLQSYQKTENKRQILLQKMNEDLRRQQYYKDLKEGKITLQ